MRRTWPQRLLIGFNSCLVVVCLGSATALAYYQRQVSGIRRVPLQGVLDRQDDVTKPVNFLLVGSDSGSDTPAGQSAGRSGANHADSISILHIDPGRDDIALLSLPRDLWVRVPGRFGEHKIAESLTFANPPGDPGLLIQTIQENFRIPIHHYVKVDFEAFRSLVDELDGVNLWFDRPSQDVESGLYVDQRGCVLADGQTALAFARSRHLRQKQDDGRYGPEDPTSDIGRIQRQQYFLKQAAKRAIARGARNPVSLANLIGIAQRYVEIDDVLTPGLVLDIGTSISDFDPDQVQVLQPDTVPKTRSGLGGEGLALRSAVEADQLFTRFREQPPAGASPSPPPSSAQPSTTAPATSNMTAPGPPPLAHLSFVPHPPPGTAC